MSIAIVDADLIGRKNHRFPNLACEKISAFWKEQGEEVELKTDYDNFEKYDQVFVSKVFTDTPVPEFLCQSSKIHIGGTGFFFDVGAYTSNSMSGSVIYPLFSKNYVIASTGQGELKKHPLIGFSDEDGKVVREPQEELKKIFADNSNEQPVSLLKARKQEQEYINQAGKQQISYEVTGVGGEE